MCCKIGTAFREWLIELAPDSYRADARRLYGQIKETWQAYLWGQIVLMLIIGVLSGVASAAVGLPGSAVVLGLIAGVLDIMPSGRSQRRAACAIAITVAWYQGAPAYMNLSDVWFAMLLLGVFGGHPNHRKHLATAAALWANSLAKNAPGASFSWR